MVENRISFAIIVFDFILSIANSNFNVRPYLLLLISLYTHPLYNWSVSILISAMAASRSFSKLLSYSKAI